MKIKTCFSQKPLGRFNQSSCVSFYVHRNNNSLIDAGHMTNDGNQCPYMVKTLQKSSSLESAG